jgi:hypothetical protein
MDAVPAVSRLELGLDMGRRGVSPTWSRGVSAHVEPAREPAPMWSRCT